VKAGVGLVARGRLLPAISANGFDAWRVGPLDPADERWLPSLAAVFPPEAHALPIPGVRPLRVRSPESLVRECWDAIADALVRSPAASMTSRSRAFAGQRPVRVESLRDWLATATQGLREGARPGLRLVPPREADPPGQDAEPGPAPGHEGSVASQDRPRGSGANGSDTPLADGRFTAVVQLRSHADPSLVVDAGDLWRSPEAVLRRFGDSVETDLLLALRRGARAWPPLTRLLDAARPERLVLDHDETPQPPGPPPP